MRAARAVVACAAMATLPAARPDAADSEDVVRLLAAQDAAVVTVGTRLAVAAAPWCADQGWATGMTVQALSQFGRDYRLAARRVYGVGDRPTVFAVAPAGPAARAGLATGDALLSVDGKETAPVRSDGAATIDDTSRATDLIESAMRDGVAQFVVRRDGQQARHRLQGVRACRVRFEVRAGSDTNASADAARVQVSSDLVDPDRQAEDLAPVLAHELAHVVLRHPQTLARHFRGLLPGFGKGGAAIRASEIAADRLSLYILARAGYRPEDAVAFWTRFLRATDMGLLSDRTHPGWKTRVAALGEELARLNAMKARGEAVTPPADLLTPSR